MIVWVPTGSVTPDDNSKISSCWYVSTCACWATALKNLGFGYWRVTKVQRQTLISCPIELQQQQQKVTFDGCMTQSWQTKTFNYFEIPTNEDLWERERSGFDAESPLQQLGWPPLSAGDVSNSSFVVRLVPFLIEFIIIRPKLLFRR